MNDFKNNGFKKGVPKFGGKKKNVTGNKHAGRHRRERTGDNTATELFPATCSDCGKKCEVPFRPSSDKPIYCSACFGMKKSANEPRTPVKENRSDYQKPPREDRAPRHDPTRGRNDEGIADLKRQLAGLEQKLNRILDLINPPLPSQKVPTPIAEKVITKTATKVSAKKTTKATPKKAVKKVATKAVPKKVAKKAAKVAVKKAPKK